MDVIGNLHVGCGNHGCGREYGKFLTECPDDPCKNKCEPECQEEPCRRYECPVKLYDKCVSYSGTAMVLDGIPEGSDIGVVIDKLRDLIAYQDKAIQVYHNEVISMKKLVNELYAAYGGEGSGQKPEEEETW